MQKPTTNSNLSESTTAARASYPSWRALIWFALFRLLVAAALNLAFIPLFGTLWKILPATALSLSVSITYSALVLLALVLSGLRWPSKRSLIQTSVFIDIVAFTLLMYGNGGVQSGFGLLLAIAVAAGALLMEGRLSMLFASFATLGVISQQIYAQLSQTSAANSLTHAGLLGVTYFTVAILAHVLYRRIQETEWLAARRQVDIADLSKLNEFIIQSMGTGVLVVDEQHRLRLMNAAASQLLGVTDGHRGEYLAHLAPELYGWLCTSIDPKGYGGSTATVSVANREIKPSFTALGEGPTGALIIFLRDNQELIREAQQIKLASLGRLSASIAHNIRNPLSALKHAAQLLAESPALPQEDRHLTQIIQRNTGRIDEIIESILQLSRRRGARPEPIDLRSWLSDFCVEFTETRRLPEGRLELQIAPDTPDISTDPRHLHQVLTVLCDNAVDHAGTRDRPARICVSAGAAPTAGGAFVEVQDDGRGIGPETEQEMFTPFFTTSVCGTGLGLYVARELSEANAIDFNYVRPSGNGSRFRLVFSGVRAEPLSTDHQTGSSR